MSRFHHPERNAKIVDLRRRGWQPAEIAARLEISRNAVIGVLYRAGLTDSFSHKAHGRGGDYDAADKARAVTLAAKIGNAKEAARRADIPYETLRGWIRRAA